MTAALKDMLAVEDVWFWSQNETVSEKFVLWAGSVLQHRYLPAYQWAQLLQLLPPPSFSNLIL